MSDRVGQARRLGQRIVAGWGTEDVEAQLASLHARRTRRRRVVVIAPIAGVAVAAAIALVVWNLRGSSPAPVAIEVAPPVAPPPDTHVTPAPPAPVIDHVGAAAPPAPHDEVIAPKHAPAMPVVRLEPEPPSTWRDDAARGDYDAAWAGLAKLTVTLDRMDDLLLAGDVARLSGHAAAAVAPLDRAVALHPDDPRAQLAAFSLGRVHLDNLGSPRAAADAFARARALAPDGPLAEDALAREVEAWSRAGETETARQRALVYVQKYPAGHRVRAVRRFGGLEGN